MSEKGSENFGEEDDTGEDDTVLELESAERQEEGQETAYLGAEPGETAWKVMHDAEKLEGSVKKERRQNKNPTPEEQDRLAVTLELAEIKREGVRIALEQETLKKLKLLGEDLQEDGFPFVSKLENITSEVTEKNNQRLEALKEKLANMPKKPKSSVYQEVPGVEEGTTLDLLQKGRKVLKTHPQLEEIRQELVQLPIENSVLETVLEIAQKKTVADEYDLPFQEKLEALVDGLIDDNIRKPPLLEEKLRNLAGSIEKSFKKRIVKNIKRKKKTNRS